MDAGVSEIHRQPSRPPGFEEPLFLGRSAKKEIAEHLRESSGWLWKADEVRTGGAGRTGEVCHVLSRPDGSALLVRARRGFGRPAARRHPRCRISKRRVARVVERWWEVRSWWEPGREIDRLCFRVVLSDGAEVDLALDRSGERAGSWSLVCVID